MGIEDVQPLVLSYNIAYVLGVHFKAGEWGNRRCGSVVTLIHDGRSRYCIVRKFVEIAGKGYACVDWLSKPSYPHAPITLVSVVRQLHPHEQTDLKSVIPLDMIDPTPVLVDRDGRDFYMMRVKGYDPSGM